jgi:hypothetical protein
LVCIFQTSGDCHNTMHTLSFTVMAGWGSVPFHSFPNAIHFSTGRKMRIAQRKDCLKQEFLTSSFFVCVCDAAILIGVFVVITGVFAGLGWVCTFSRVLVHSTHHFSSNVGHTLTNLIHFCSTLSLLCLRSLQYSRKREGAV